MKRLNIGTWKKLSRLRKAVTLFTRHYEGDRYHGVLLAVQKELLILEVDNDFVFDGIVALPKGRLKKLRCGPHEKMIDQIYSRYKLLKLPKRPSWLIKSETAQQLIGECHRRKLWPLIEIQSKGINALYVGPVTKVGIKDFYIYCYDAHGKWEKNYRLNYREIFKIQLFDKYSTYFNRFMRENTRTMPKFK